MSKLFGLEGVLLGWRRTAGGERWFDVLYSEQTPDVYYALPFANTQAYADAQGQHYGTHPCAAILMTTAEYAALIAALGDER